MPASHRRNLKNLRPKNRNSPFAVFFQIKGLFEANWRSLAQIEGDCITPIKKMIEKAGKKRRFLRHFLGLFGS